MRCIVVDDDEMSRKVVARFVEQTDFLELSKVCSTAIEAVNLLKKIGRAHV